MEPSKHVCGVCGQDFTSEKAYLDHKCQKTGFTPRDPEHLGEDFALIQDAALRRGLDRAEGADAKRTKKAIDDLGVIPPEPQ